MHAAGRAVVVTDALSRTSSGREQSNQDEAVARPCSLLPWRRSRRRPWWVCFAARRRRRCSSAPARQVRPCSRMPAVRPDTEPTSWFPSLRRPQSRLRRRKRSAYRPAIEANKPQAAEAEAARVDAEVENARLRSELQQERLRAIDSKLDALLEVAAPYTVQSAWCRSESCRSLFRYAGQPGTDALGELPAGARRPSRRRPL